MATSAEKHHDRSGPLHDPHREHLRRLRAGLALTAVAIQTGAAAITESVKLLSRLDGQVDGKADAP